MAATGSIPSGTQTSSPGSKQNREGRVLQRALERAKGQSKGSIKATDPSAALRPHQKQATKTALLTSVPSSLMSDRAALHSLMTVPKGRTLTAALPAASPAIPALRPDDKPDGVRQIRDAGVETAAVLTGSLTTAVVSKLAVGRLKVLKPAASFIGAGVSTVVREIGQAGSALHDRATKGQASQDNLTLVMLDQLTGQVPVTQVRWARAWGTSGMNLTQGLLTAKATQLGMTTTAKVAAMDRLATTSLATKTLLASVAGSTVTQWTQTAGNLVLRNGSRFLDGWSAQDQAALSKEWGGVAVDAFTAPIGATLGLLGPQGGTVKQIAKAVGFDSLTNFAFGAFSKAASGEGTPTWADAGVALMQGVSGGGQSLLMKKVGRPDIDAAHDMPYAAYQPYLKDRSGATLPVRPLGTKLRTYKAALDHAISTGLEAKAVSKIVDHYRDFDQRALALGLAKRGADLDQIKRWLPQDQKDINVSGYLRESLKTGHSLDHIGLVIEGSGGPGRSVFSTDRVVAEARDAGIETHAIKALLDTSGFNNDHRTIALGFMKHGLSVADAVEFLGPRLQNIPPERQLHQFDSERYVLSALAAQHDPQAVLKAGRWLRDHGNHNDYLFFKQQVELGLKPDELEYLAQKFPHDHDRYDNSAEYKIIKKQFNLSLTDFINLKSKFPDIEATRDAIIFIRRAIEKGFSPHEALQRVNQYENGTEAYYASEFLRYGSDFEHAYKGVLYLEHSEDRAFFIKKLKQGMEPWKAFFETTTPPRERFKGIGSNIRVSYSKGVQSVKFERPKDIILALDEIAHTLPITQPELLDRSTHTNLVPYSAMQLRYVHRFKGQQGDDLRQALQRPYFSQTEARQTVANLLERTTRSFGLDINSNPLELSATFMVAHSGQATFKPELGMGNSANVIVPKPIIDQDTRHVENIHVHPANLSDYAKSYISNMHLVDHPHLSDADLDVLKSVADYYFGKYPYLLSYTSTTIDPNKMTVSVTYKNGSDIPSVELGTTGPWRFPPSFQLGKHSIYDSISAYPFNGKPEPTPLSELKPVPPPTP